MVHGPFRSKSTTKGRKLRWKSAKNRDEELEMDSDEDDRFEGVKKFLLRQCLLALKQFQRVKIMMSARETFGRKQSVGQFNLGCMLEEKEQTQLWRAVNADSGEAVVIKILHDKASMKREAESLLKLKGAYSPAVYDFRESLGRFYYAMEEFSRTLQSYLDLNESKSFSCMNVIMITNQIMSALQYSTRMGYLHGNINPDHIMISKPRGVENNVLVKMVGYGNVQKLEICDDKVVAIDIDLEQRNKKYSAPGTLMYSTLTPVDELIQITYLLWIMNAVDMLPFEASDGGFEFKFDLSMSPMKILPRRLKWLSHFFSSLPAFDSKDVPDYGKLQKALTLCVRDFPRSAQLMLKEDEGLLILE